MDVATASNTSLAGLPARFERGLKEIGPGVFAWLQPNGGWGEANAGLIVGDGESLLIDTLWDEKLAAEMLAEMAKVTGDNPITKVVNTHSDGDHWWGNAAVPAGANIFTCTPSRSAMDEESHPGELARLAGLAGKTRWLPGSIGRLTRYVDDMLSPFDLRHVTLRYPDESFDERLTIEVGRRAVQLTVVGPAHTPGDTIAFVADAGIVFAADILFIGAIPVMWQGPVGGWIAALDTILALDAEVFVPGHGPVCGRADVKGLKQFWEVLYAAARKRHSAGASPSAAAEQIIRSAAFDEWRDWVGPERLLINLTTLFREFNGEPPLAVTPAVRAKLFRQVAELHERIS